MQSGIYHDVERLYNSVAAKLNGKGSADVQSPMLANIPVNETELAACLVTLGVPLRHPAPFTDCDQDDGRRIKTWWLGQGSDSGHKTEDIVAAWWFRDRMREEHPLHPLNPMREALDARNWWLSVKHREIPLPAEAVGFFTDSLRAASILRAGGYVPMAFTGRAFVLEMAHQGMPAQEMLSIADKPEGAAGPQWMREVLKNLDKLFAHMRGGSRIIRVTDGARSMLLTADATPKTVAKFENLL